MRNGTFRFGTGLRHGRVARRLGRPFEPPALGAAVTHGGTMTAASGWRSATDS